MARSSSPEPPDRTHLVLGTAGHIDHGKTALVRALTGIDTDRLPEEKARGITIELGFAALDLGDGLRLGVVDVPGHERLVRTMVAGANGIDLVLLVVAADEGVMPQTREHVAICQLLGLSRGVVALTKVDTVSGDVVSLAAEEVQELLAPTGLADAPILRVAAPTGEGVPELREALAAAARQAAARTARTGPPRLAVDRVFTMRGFGTVVTGTLVGSALAVGDAVELLPGRRRARVRGLESHGARAERVAPGSRCAVNLQGVELAEVGRGDLLTAPDALAPTRLLDLRVHWLEGAPPVRESAAVTLLAGTAERRARLAPIGTPGLAPGGVGYARLHVEGEPLALLPGDRVVLQGFARTEHGGTTLGGGVVLDVAPPHRRRGDPALQRDLEALARGEPELDVRVRVERAGLAGIDAGLLRRQTGYAPAVLEPVLRGLEERGEIARTPGDTCVSERALAELARRVEAAVGAFHAREPLRPGMPRGVLRGALPENVPASVLDLALGRLAAKGRIAVEQELVRRRDHRAALGERERKLARRLAEAARAAGLEPPTLREWSAQLGETPERMRELLSHLEREGRLVRAPGELWFDADAVEALRERIVAHLRQHEALETPAYKALIGTTRKHAVPLMELFDGERLTLRVGNRRVLRGAPAEGSPERSPKS